MNRRTFISAITVGFGRRLTRPFGAFASFNLVLVAWHLPPLYNLAMDHRGVHIVQHLMIMVVSVILWWPRRARLPDRDQRGLLPIAGRRRPGRRCDAGGFQDPLDIVGHPSARRAP
jgi:hypothetical protein